MNYPAASYEVSKDNMFCHSVLDTNEASYGEFNPISHENLRNLWIKILYPH